MRPHNQTALIFATIGAAVPILSYGVVRLFTHGDRPGKTIERKNAGDRKPSVAGPSSWTPLQLCHVLANFGVSRGTIQLLQAYNVDGNTFSQITPEDLLQMRIPRADIQIILTAQHELFGRDEGGNGGPAVSHFIEDAGEAFHRILDNGDDSEPNDRAHVASSVYDLLDHFRRLSSEEQHQSMAPLARQLSVALLHDSDHKRQATPSTPPFHPRERRPSQAEMTLSSFHEMLDGFINLLRSAQVQRLPPSELKELKIKVADQLQSVQAVAQMVPPEVARPLLEKCSIVHHLLSKATESTAVSSRQLIEELKGVFARVRNPEFAGLPAEAKVDEITAMMKCVAGVLEESDSLPSEKESVAVKGMASQIMTVLNMLRTECTKSARETPTRGLPSISEGLKEVLQVLKSDDLNNASDEVRGSVLLNLQKKIVAIQEESKKLPEREQKPVEQVSAQLLRLIQTQLENMRNAADAAVEEEEEEEDEVRNREAAFRESVETEDELDLVVGEMERIFNLLNSEEFKSSTAEQKRVIAGNLLERVCAAKARVLELSEGDNPIITELIVPLEELLERMTDSGHASEQFLEICETLSEIKDLIHSPDFVSATAEVKVGVVRQVLPQLKTISATFPTLSPKERKAVEQLIDPINSELQSILRGTTRTAPTQPKQSPQSTILRLQQVMGVLQSEEFATASPEERQELVEQCTADLRELKQEAKEGLGEMAGNVVPIIDRLLKQLEELSSHDSETLRGGEEKPDAVERRKFFESLEGITTVLKQRNDKQAGDFGGDVTAFVELSKLASTIDNLSEEEERIKSEFEKELAKLFSDAQGEEEEEEGKVNLADFKRFFATVLNHLTTTGVSTFEESAMVMSRVEGVLSEADRSGLEWRTDKESVTLVQNVLAEIQKSQQNLRSTDSRIKNLLDEATARINENPNMNSDELDSYYDFLQQVQAKQANFSLPELQAFKNFQEAILRASRQATNNSSRMNKEDITSTLLEISDRLRDSKMSPEELDQYDGIVAQLMNANLGEEFKEPLASIKEQIHLQRVSNDPEAYGGSDKPEDEEKSSDDDPVIENNESSEEAQSDTNELSGVRIDEDVDENGVNLVNLLPKIEEKVGLTNEAFTKSCSKFDVQMISKILVTISFSKMYHQDKALKARVDGLKTTFLEKLKAFEGSDSPSTDVMPSKKLRVTGEEVDSEDGLHAKEFTIYTESEADNFTENPELMRLMCNENLAETEVAEGVKENWVGKSCAFIISCNCTPQTDTSLAEITLLRDVLAKRYNFDVQIILDPKLNAENFEKIITRHVEEHKPNRLLLFYHSPKAHEGVAVPHSVLFHDSSVLSHKRILEVTKEVERLLIIQSLPRQLEISGRLREEFSPLMTVRLSSSASKEISSCRCWLFDDIFTPIVIELLSREEAKLLCPEDVMNYALTASTTLDFGFGSFMKREASSMGYFSPTSPNQ